MSMNRISRESILKWTLTTLLLMCSMVTVGERLCLRLWIQQSSRPDFRAGRQSVCCRGRRWGNVVERRRVRSFLKTRFSSVSVLTAVAMRAFKPAGSQWWSEQRVS